MLNLDYAADRYELEGFTGKDYSFKKLKPSSRQDTYKDSLKERAKRIAYDSLDDYAQKENRNAILFEDKEVLMQESIIMELLSRKRFSAAREGIEKYMQIISRKLIEKGVPRGYWK